MISSLMKIKNFAKNSEENVNKNREESQTSVRSGPEINSKNILFQNF